MKPESNGFMAEVFALGEIQIDPTSLDVTRPDGSEKIEPKAMQVLLCLAKASGRVVSRQELEAEVWPGRVVTPDAVTNAVAKLR